MIDKVRKLIKEYGMIASGDAVIAGVSGGADSVCLLAVLKALEQELGFQVSAVHVHHGLRGGEADRDQLFVQKLCENMGVSCSVFQYDVRREAKERGLSEEEAGRELRYASFEEAAGPYGETGRRVRIAVAHHMGDSAETILMNLFRGSGLAGLGGIPPVRGNVIRPLLCVSRSEIEDWLAARGLGYCQDSTNASLCYTRNKIRGVLLPYAEKEINSQSVKNILHAGHMICQAEEYLVEETLEFYQAHVKEEDGRISLAIDPLLEKKGIFCSYVIRRLLAEAAGQRRDITSAHIEAVRGLLYGESGRRVSLPYGLTAGREHNILFVETKEKPEITKNFTNWLHMLTFPYVKGAEIPKNMYTKWFDYDKIMGTLSVRSRQPGDYITLAGGGRKTVKSFMIDEKIPGSLRGSIPLVADGSHILWIVGYRISEHYKVTDNTNTILQIEYDGGNGHGRQNQSVID